MNIARMTKYLTLNTTALGGKTKSTKNVALK